MRATRDEQLFRAMTHLSSIDDRPDSDDRRLRVDDAVAKLCTKTLLAGDDVTHEIVDPSNPPDRCRT